MQPPRQRVIRARFEAAKALRRTAEFDDSLIDHRNKGHLARLAGLENFLGWPVYRIEMVLNDGLLMTWYIDRETYLPVANRRRIPVHARGEHLDTTTQFSDFRPVAGFLYPFRLTDVDPQTGKTTDPQTGGWAAVVANIRYDVTKFSPPPVNPPPITRTMLQMWATSGMLDLEEWFAPYKRFRDDPANATVNTEEDLNWLAYEMLKENEIGKALLLLTTGAEEYPRSADSFDSLGDAFLQALDRKAAMENYEKAITLDPSLEATRRKLEQLRAESK